MANQDALGNRMKQYEDDDKLMPMLPAFARLDGKVFHTFTRGMKRPWDSNFSYMMMDTCKHLMEFTNALVGYTQSDEITFMWYNPQYGSQIFMDGRKAKMISILAASASVFFNKILHMYFPDRLRFSPIFDCRVWNVPILGEALNVFVWRELDAVRNSIQSAGHAYYSHKELQNKSSSEIQEMLFQKGINWNDYPDYFKRGTYFRREMVVRAFTSGELEKLPEKHEARKNPNLVVERMEVKMLRIPPLLRIKNRQEALFEGADPILLAEDKEGGSRCQDTK